MVAIATDFNVGEEVEVREQHDCKFHRHIIKHIRPINDTMCADFGDSYIGLGGDGIRHLESPDKGK